jgi:hypothetical protein
LIETAPLLKKLIMKKLSFLSIVLLLLIYSGANAQGYKTALGVRFSSRDAVVNHSISFKHFFRETTAVEALVSFVKPYAVGVLVEKHHSFPSTSLTWFWGAGAYAGFSEGKNFGAQGALGLDFKVPEIPINLSIDWKPELNLVEKVFFEPAAAGVTARFTF